MISEVLHHGIVVSAR